MIIGLNPNKVNISDAWKQFLAANQPQSIFFRQQYVAGEWGDTAQSGRALLPMSFTKHFLLVTAHLNANCPITRRLVRAYAPISLFGQCSLLRQRFLWHLIVAWSKYTLWPSLARTWLNLALSSVPWRTAQSNALSSACRKWRRTVISRVTNAENETWNKCTFDDKPTIDFHINLNPMYFVHNKSPRSHSQVL